jgi:hypothetical protein
MKRVFRSGKQPATKGGLMKTLFTLVVLLVFVAAPAHGQAGAVGIFGDPQGVNPCGLSDRSAGLAVYYVVHIFTPGAVGVEYSAPAPWCLKAQWLSDTNAFPVTIGNSQVGVSVGYGTCRVGPILVQSINYFVRGLTPDCCCYDIRPHPINGGPNMVDCTDNLLVASAARGIINSTTNCPCNACLSPACVEAFSSQIGGCIKPPVPADATTWGRVKSMYSD